MGFISWSTARTLLATCILASTATASGTIVDGNYTLPVISTQTAAATGALPAATDKAALLALASKTIATAFSTANDRCPATCSDAGPNPSNWTVLHDTKRLAACNETLLLNFVIHNPLNDPSTHVTIRTCSTGNNATVSESPSRLRRDVDSSCAPAPNNQEIQVSLQVGSLGSSNQASATNVVAAAQQMLNYLSQTNSSCNSTVLFANSGPASVGIFAGSQIQAQGISTTILQQFIDQIQKDGLPGSYVAQLCGSDGRGIDFALGIAANVDSSLDFVQEAVTTWSLGKCVTSYGSQAMDLASWNTATLWVPTPSSNSTSSVYSNNTSSMTTLSERATYLSERTTYCTTIQVVSGDNCSSLATKCGITGAQFTTYNPSSTECSSLTAGEHVCCSAGTMPNFSPQPNADGSCHTYLVVADDSCYNLAATYSITVDEINVWNNDTWGFEGCQDLQIGQTICLSSGSPPMPATVANAVCGPQVVGTAQPTDMTTLASLNPCPLNACCDIWGQCGTTDEFCTASEGLDGAPGTAAAGQNGCISNCGDGIIIGSAPAEFRKIGYFEGFNANRPCLNMNVSDVNKGSYTHIHMAFATITDNFNVDVSDIQDQFNQFVAMTGVKRILSFGGWSFSTSADSYGIFRSGVTAANRDVFATNVVSFVIDNDLDGVDFDWEYPGATDIPGVPPGSTEDGTNYFLFLYQLKILMPSQYTISIAAPASFWYLKNFPIDIMSLVVDYIIFMTYDLHGQWDYGNAYSDPGCSLGNCLRSHVNLTETINALSMITKAGVASNQVIVGIASYGRAFQMTEAGCTGEMCTYTGPASGATPGQCTQTAGYIAEAEIDNIIATSTTTTWRDSTLSNIMVYNETQWVSYMDPANKALRTSLYEVYGMGGTSEWAIDLADFGDGDSEYGAGTDNSTAPCDPSLKFASLAALEAVADTLPLYCAEIYALNALSAELSTAIANYTSVDNDYDSTFKYYVQYVQDMVPDAIGNFMTTGAGPSYFKCILSIGGKNSTAAPCPIDEEGGGETIEVYWIFNNETGFWADLLNQGIEQDWVIQTPYGWPGNDCCYTYMCNPCGSAAAIWYNYPQPSTNITVTNPKDIITTSFANVTAMQQKIDATWIDTIFGQWNGSALDAVEVLAMPVALVQEAIAGMVEVKSIGQAQKKADKINYILGILTIVFAVVPFVGEESAIFFGLADLARIIALTGELANIGLGSYTIDLDHNSAPMAIFGMLLGASSIARDPENMALMATLRRSMTDDAVASMGKTLVDQTATIQKIARICVPVPT